MIVCGLDLETTGLLTPDHRIIEVFAGRWNEHGKLLDTYEQRIDPQRSIALDAQRVHGISAGMLAGCPTWSEVAKDVHAFLSDADLIVAHNGEGFDFLFLNQEFKRVGLPPIPASIPRVDTMLTGRFASPMGEAPSLQNLCFALDVEYDTSKAHAASYDVHCMMECYFRAVRWNGFFKLPALPSTESEAARAA